MANIPAISPPDGQEGQHAKLCIEFIKDTLKIVLPFVAGYFVHVLQTRWEAGSRIRKGKDEFLIVLADQRAKFATMKLREAEFFEQSVPILVTAVYRVQHFITAEEWSRLHQVMREYQSHHKSEFEGGHARAAAATNAQLGVGKTYEQTLREFLDRFEECVQKSA